jgi:hypothetical protein
VAMTRLAAALGDLDPLRKNPRFQKLVADTA